MIRLVVRDTNVLISAIFWHGPPRTLIDPIRSEDIWLLSTEAILTELEQKLNGKKLARYFEASGTSPDQVMRDYRKIALIVEPAEVPEDAVRDKNDRIILACAVGGNADCIASGDQDLTSLHPYNGIPILTPAQLLTILRSPPDSAVDEDKP